MLLGASQDHSEVLFPNPAQASMSLSMPMLAKDPVPVMPEHFLGRPLCVFAAVCGALDRRLVTIAGHCSLLEHDRLTS